MNRNTFNKAVVPGLFAFMVSGYKPKNSEALWRKLCTVKSSKRAYEENAYFSTLGTIPAKPEGTAITYDEFVQGPTKRWTHKTYGLNIPGLLRSNLEVIKETVSGKLLRGQFRGKTICLA